VRLHPHVERFFTSVRHLTRSVNPEGIRSERSAIAERGGENKGPAANAIASALVDGTVRCVQVRAPAHTRGCGVGRHERDPRGEPVAEHQPLTRRGGLRPETVKATLCQPQSVCPVRELTPDTRRTDQRVQLCATSVWAFSARPHGRSGNGHRVGSVPEPGPVPTQEPTTRRACGTAQSVEHMRLPDTAQSVGPGAWVGSTRGVKAEPGEDCRPAGAQTGAEAAIVGVAASRRGQRKHAGSGLPRRSASRPASLLAPVAVALWFRFPRRLGTLSPSMSVLLRDGDWMTHNSDAGRRCAARLDDRGHAGRDVAKFAVVCLRLLAGSGHDRDRRTWGRPGHVGGARLPDWVVSLLTRRPGQGAGAHFHRKCVVLQRSSRIRSRDFLLVRPRNVAGDRGRDGADAARDYRPGRCCGLPRPDFAAVAPASEDLDPRRGPAEHGDHRAAGLSVAARGVIFWSLISTLTHF